MALKDKLPELRERAGFTQQTLAEKLFVTRQAISRWETGETTFYLFIYLFTLQILFPSPPLPSQPLTVPPPTPPPN